MAEKLAEKDLASLDALLKEYEGTKGALIPVLQRAQDIFGYLPREVIIRIADSLGAAVSQVYGVVTFYAQFHLSPRGKNIIRSCQGTACHVRGAKAILAEIRKHLGLNDDQVTTPDRKYTLETVACIGCCGLAPVMMINDDTHGRLTPDKVNEILNSYQG